MLAHHLLIRHDPEPDLLIEGGVLVLQIEPDEAILGLGGGCVSLTAHPQHLLKGEQIEFQVGQLHEVD